MFEIKVRESLFVAHSLKDDFFGPAKNLHGATYVVDLIIKSRTLDNHNVVCDIEFAHNILKDCIAKYNYLNLDDIDELKDKITTTEFMARQLVDDFAEKIHILKDSSNVDIQNIYSIKMTLNESHKASASYEKVFNE